MSTIQPTVLKTLRLESLAKINQGKRRTHMVQADFTDVNPGFVGNITFHYPSQLERIQIGVTKSALLGGNLDVDVVTNNIAFIAATLDTVLDAKPDWLDMDNPDLEYEVLLAIYNEYETWVSSFRRTAKPDTDSGDSTGTGGQVPVVGNEDVSRTADGEKVSGLDGGTVRPAVQSLPAGQ